MSGRDPREGDSETLRPPASGGAGRRGREGERARLARALRENLKRRKRQARARRGQASGDRDRESGPASSDAGDT